MTSAQTGGGAGRAGEPGAALILLLALAAGVAVGNAYFPQVVVPGVAGGLGVAAGAAAQVVSATHAG
ncbi:hypothetical protein ACU635_32225 [[Actinomadura] parvosata]|uniref:hypothetical protein n=1 Tax=[Actinomadura] parvosata TaxID=1955412 RepID=UPI00406D0D43